MQIIETLNQTFYELFDYGFNPNQRIYYVYLLGALLLAGVIFFTSNRKKSLPGFMRFVFAKKIWLSASAKQDYLILVVNKIIRALLLAPVIITIVPIAITTTEIFEGLFGRLNPVTNNQWIITLSFTLLLFMLDDLSRFVLHYCLHKIPFLWEIHKVHHSAKVLTPITVYRSHPIENYLFACRLALAQGLSIGIIYYLFGASESISVIQLAGASIFVFAFNFMGSNLRHSHIRISWGKKLEHWFISPAQHQIHHSDNPKHFDRNFGSALAIWDRMAGTLITADQAKRIRFGIGRDFQGHDSIAQIYWLPIKSCSKKLLSLFRLNHGKLMNNSHSDGRLGNDSLSNNR